MWYCSGALKSGFPGPDGGVDSLEIVKPETALSSGKPDRLPDTDFSGKQAFYLLAKAH